MASSNQTGKPMFVKKRAGHLEEMDSSKVLRRVTRAAEGLLNIDCDRVASKAIRGIFDGVTTRELDELLVKNAAMLIGEGPEYSKLAARLLLRSLESEISAAFNIVTFTDSARVCHRHGLLNEETASFIESNGDRLNAAIDATRNDRFEYFGLYTVCDRYLLRHPELRTQIESPQHFFMRVACGLSTDVDMAIRFYDLISSFSYMPSTPTLFNSGTKHQQMSSCYLLDSPADDLRAIYEKYLDVALLSKFAGGIGLAYHRVRSRGALIKGTNGESNGIIPFLKTLDSSVGAVNQGGRRKGAACVYLETWHADIAEFLQLKNNTGDEAQRTHNLNIANWVPDLFMRRVKENGIWSLFSPSDVPQFTDLYGDEFTVAYEAAEKAGIYREQIPARELYATMMKTLAQTGNGWMTFKDASNKKSNQTGEANNVIHLSNLCTEILEVTSENESAVCNLGSINLAEFVGDDREFDFRRLAEVVQLAVVYLDRVVDVNFYPIDKAKASNSKWRPVGLGVMGLQDVFFKMRVPFDGPEAASLSSKIQEEIYYHALSASCDLAEKHGPHSNFSETRAAKGQLQFDLWGVTPSSPARWAALKERIVTVGLRNSLLIAVAPTATIASIVGSYECIEPQVSNLFKRETLSGEFLQINGYLVEELRSLGLWNAEMRDRIKSCDGSIQSIGEIPEEIRRIYRTVWEIPMKAIISLAAARGPYIDQSQSLNLFVENPNIGKLSSMYAYAWEMGLKTTYYLRSRAATQISKTTIAVTTESAAVACSLENPEACESCQ